MKKSGRIKYIDIAKCLAMYLVIHNHWMMNYGNNSVKIVIAAFHMPLFFVLSGLTVKTPESFKDVLVHIFKRIKTVLLPYYMWSMLYVGFHPKKLCLILWGSNLSIGAGGGIGGSWFLPCFFISDILAVTALYLCRKNIKIIMAFAAAFFGASWGLNQVELFSIGLPFNFDVALSGAGFICIGLLATRYDLFKKLASSSVAVKLTVLVLSAAGTAAFAFLNTSAYENSYERLVMARGFYGNFLMFIAGGLCGTVLIVLLSMIIEKVRLSDKLQKIGMNTFTILLLQQVCINAAEKIISKAGLTLNFLYPLILSVVCLIVCHIAGLIITSIFPNLGGKYVMFDCEKNIMGLLKRRTAIDEQHKNT